jgi:hypothetical protein
MNRANIASHSRQRGTTLIIAIVLLLLLTMVGLFALNVGLSEQRASGTEFRGRIVRQVAESGLSQTFEYLRLSGRVPTEPQGEVDLTRWQPCAANDTTFPCGVVPQTVLRDTDDDGAADDVTAFRGASYRYIGDGGFDLDGNSTIDNLERYFIPMADIVGTTSSQGITQVGNFPVRYGVAAVLCTLDDNRACVGASGADEDRSGLATVTLVAIAEIAGEDARATITQTYGSFNIFSVPPSAPPLVAGGILQGVGNSTIVANPDSGGVGVPVSIWTRGPMDVNNGSWQTCQLDEYMRAGLPGVSETGVIICDDCDCVTGQKESKGQGQGGPQIGLDIQTPRSGANDDDDYWDGPDNTVDTSDDTLASQFFPCDLFGYVFGVNARNNTNGADANGDGIADAEGGLPYGICEDGVDANADGRLDSMVSFLQQIEAKQFGTGKTDPDNTITPGKALASCASLDAGSNGIYWMEAAECDLTADQVGSPDNPVVIVGEKGFQLIGTRVFGVLIGVDSTLIDINEGDLSSLRPTFRAGGGKSSVYGSFIVEGGGKVNANIDLVASPKVIENVGGNPSFRRFGTVPGSWSDRFSY